MSKRQRHFTLMAVGTLSTLLALSLWAQNETPKSSAGPKVAVVNVQTIFKGLDEHKAIEAELRSLGDQVKKAILDKDQKIKSIQKTLESGAVKPGSDQYTKMLDDLALKRLELDTIRKYGQVKTTRQTTQRLAELYKKVLESIDKIAKDKGYDLVLHALDRSAIRGASPRQLSDRIDLHQVLFASSRIDISDYVKNVLNIQYNASKKTGK